jgi:hypothetical protein
VLQTESRFKSGLSANDLGEDPGGLGGPDEGLEIRILGVNVGVEGLNQLDDAAENAAVREPFRF